MRISDWSSDVCSSDLVGGGELAESDIGRHLDPVGRAEIDGGGADQQVARQLARHHPHLERRRARMGDLAGETGRRAKEARSDEHTSELKSLMRISYAVFCLKTTT